MCNDKVEMSEQKKPQAGEWWFVNGKNERVYIVGIREDGKTIFQTHKGGDMLPDFDGDWSAWHHEPRCTGWDWQPEPEPEPEWFDLTPFDGHVLRKNIDLYEDNDDDVWLPVIVYEKHTVASMKEIWGDSQKFRCLLKDAPPELVAMASKPAEDPDEWVTQDRVPARVGIDERRWIRKDVKTTIPDLANWKDCFEASAWFRDKAVNGFEHPNEPGLFLELRCRRRDLPPMPEQKTETEREVLLYWYDGNVVGRYADCPPSDPSFIPLIVRDGKVFIETETRKVVR